MPRSGSFCALLKDYGRPVRQIESSQPPRERLFQIPIDKILCRDDVS